MLRDAIFSSLSRVAKISKGMPYSLVYLLEDTKFAVFWFLCDNGINTLVVTVIIRHDQSRRIGGIGNLLFQKSVRPSEHLSVLLVQCTVPISAQVRTTSIVFEYNWL